MFREATVPSRQRERTGTGGGSRQQTLYAVGYREHSRRRPLK